MVDDKTVAKIAKKALPKSHSFWTVFWKIVTITALVVALVGTTLAVSAIAGNGQTADCLNTNLGIRNEPSVADRVAQDNFDAAQDRLSQAQVNAITHASSGQAVVTALIQAATDEHTAYTAYQTQRKTDDDARDANPVGKC